MEISLRQFNFSEPLKIEDEAVKTYMEMSPRELEHAIQQAVNTRNRADPDAFVTAFDDNGRLCRHFNDGRVEYVLITVSHCFLFSQSKTAWKKHCDYPRQILKEYRTGGFLSSEGIFEKLRFIPQVYFTKTPKRIMIGSENRGNPERKQIMCNIVLKSSYSLLESSLSLQGFESQYSCACMSKPRCVHDLR